MLENEFYNYFALNKLVYQHSLQFVTTKLEYFFIPCHLIKCKENGMEQDILIYIDDKERLDASAAANSFAHKDVKNRAYINTLGAELALKYLVSENVEVSEVKNIHSIKKILEETDIADIMLPNIHIDVRVIFDENAIFIPKSHFDYNLVPDIYLVFNLAKDHSHVKFAGFFEPKLINKNNENSDYYFIEKEKLNSPSDLVNYINSYKGNTDKDLSDEDFEIAEKFIVSMSDNDISENDKKYLIKQLLKSAELRDKFIEYENFETLSYKAMNDPQIEKKEIQPIETFDEISETIDLGLPELEELTTEEEIITEPVDENDEEISDLGDIITEDQTSTEEIQETQEEEILSFDENLIDETLSLENLELPQEETVTEPMVDVIGMENLEVSEPEKNIDEPIIEGLSIDNVEFSPIEETFEEPVTDTISLENIEIPETETLIEQTNIETISLDTTETMQVEEPDIPQEPVVDMLSFDEIEPLQTEELSVEEPQLSDFEEISDIVEEPQTEIFSEETMSFENTIEQSEPVSEENEIIEEFAQIPDIIETSEDEQAFNNIIEEDHPQYEDTSFGKNLLDNLAAQNDDDIEIEDTEQYTSAEDISSSDLLSQIDDVLNASSIADTALENEDMPTDNIDDILNEETDLNVLYNEEVSNEHQDDVMYEQEEEERELTSTVPGSALYNKKSTDKKSLIIASALIGILAISSVFIFFKPKNNSTSDIEPLPANNEIPAQPQQSISDDILASNTPQTPVKKDIETSKKVVKELKNTPQKTIKSESYLDVNKLVWDVPDALSYSTKMQNYLRTAGKSIKLSLSADLLLATEYAYTNQVKVGLTLNKNGSIQDARILSGSGSTQIDNIVLQSVKDTLNVVKPPSDEIKTPDFNLNLIIYF